MTETEIGRTSSILSLFAAVCAEDPERVLFTMVDQRGTDQRFVAAGELAAAGEAIAAALRERGFAPGDRAVLVYPPSTDFIEAFLGCLMAGLVPVPVYPPNPLRPGSGLPAFASTVAGCGARVALTHSSYHRMKSLGSLARAHWPDLEWVRTDQVPPSPRTVRWHEPAFVDEVAFLQYTSGSTTSPRGVMITHGNLLSEIACNAADLKLGPETRCVSWVPQYHDLGLISIMLSTLAGNGRTWLLSPLTFLRRPYVWFDVMSRVGATHTAAPNFAYDVAVRRTTPQQRAEWDLSTLQVVMSAAEPIRPATVRTFQDAFVGARLAPQAFYGAYGLAEHTVSVTMGGHRTLRVSRHDLETGRAVPPTDALSPWVDYFSCGRVTKPGQRLLIVDPDTQQICIPGQVGEIWVDSPTKALGYFGLPEESERVFRARTAGAPGQYLRTGDLGFLHEGELFVTGRCKDLIIIRGRNIHPHDVEDIARSSHELIRPGGLACFAVEHGDREQLVLFAESKQEKMNPQRRQEIAAAIAQTISSRLDLTMDAIVVSGTGLVRKTTSGKVRRSACRETFLSGPRALGTHATVHLPTHGWAPQSDHVATPGTNS